MDTEVTYDYDKWLCEYRNWYVANTLEIIEEND